MVSVGREGNVYSSILWRIDLQRKRHGTGLREASRRYAVGSLLERAYCRRGKGNGSCHPRWERELGAHTRGYPCQVAIVSTKR